jgi:hypothetical protein
VEQRLVLALQLEFVSWPFGVTLSEISQCCRPSSPYTPFYYSGIGGKIRLELLSRE